MLEVDIHFLVLRRFYQVFLSAIAILEYTAVAKFFREKITDAIEEAEAKSGMVFLKKKDITILKQTNRKHLKVRTPRKGCLQVQIHIYVNNEVKKAFLHSIQALGYSSAAEFFREKMRVAIDSAGQSTGFSSRLAEEKLFDEETR